MTRDLPMAAPVIEPAIPDGACCAACAAQPSAAPAAAPPAAPMPSPDRGRVVRRADDRQTTFGGLVLAAGFIGLALVWIGVTATRGDGNSWAALHLLLAGAAGTAIAAVLPFFTAALAQVAPVDRRIRVGAIGSVAGGAVAVTLGVSIGSSWLATLGGSAYLVGLALVAVSAFAPLRSRVGAGTGLVPVAYAVALADVAIGVALATTAVAGWAPVVAAWTSFKPAHAWLNVFGFVSLVVAATLVHLAPTVAGSRIRPRRSMAVALVAMMAAAPLVAAGFVAGSDAMATSGAGLEVVGALALTFGVIGVHHDRGRWTRDLDWHRFAGWSLLAAPVWFLVATTIATARIVVIGAVPAAWSMSAIGVPLAVGWVAQVLIGSWTHLIPAIGPGDQAAHAMQRRRLGRWGPPRAVAWNAGVAAMTTGVLVDAGAIVLAGAIVVAAAAMLAVALLVGSIRHGAETSVTATAPFAP